MRASLSTRPSPASPILNPSCLHINLKATLYRAEMGPSVAMRPLGFGGMAIYLSVFLITLSGLVFEIGLTRIYSATIWYHFAFMAISVALLGWGLGGLAVHQLKRS